MSLRDRIARLAIRRHRRAPVEPALIVWPSECLPDETEADWLARHGHPPDTWCIFVRLIEGRKPIA